MHYILIAFASERDFLTVVHATIDGHLLGFLLARCLLAAALLAAVLLGYLFALAATISTYGLHLLHHARTELLESNDEAAAFACRTWLCGAGFTARSCIFF